MLRAGTRIGNLLMRHYGKEYLPQYRLKLGIPHVSGVSIVVTMHRPTKLMLMSLRLFLLFPRLNNIGMHSYPK